MAVTVAGVRRGGAIKKPASVGPIVAGELYTKDQFLARTRWKERAFSTAARSGLEVIKQGNIVFVDGTTFIAWMKTRASN